MNASNEFPSWLYDYISDSVIGAGSGCVPYASLWQHANNNLHNTHDDNLEYLHSYFLRSFSEVQDVIKELLKSAETLRVDIEERAASGNPVRILSVGAGTGGDAIGLIEGLLKISPDLSFEIHLIDGNLDAVTLAEKILLEQRKNYDVTMDTMVTVREFHAPQDFQKTARELGRFDFVLATKFLQEISRHDMEHPYYSFINAFSDNLTDKGLMLLISTTDRPAGFSLYHPCTLNMEAHMAAKDRPDALALVYPLPCRAATGCRRGVAGECYTRLYCRNSSSGYAVRVLASSAYARRLIPEVAPGYYPVNYKEDLCLEVCEVEAEMMQAG